MAVGVTSGSVVKIFDFGNDTPVIAAHEAKLSGLLRTTRSPVEAFFERFPGVVKKPGTY